MMRGVFVLFLFATPLLAQEELRWKWRSDDTFYVETITKVKQTFVLDDPKAAPQFKERELKQEYEVTSWVRYNVRKRNDDGSAILVQRVVKDYGEVKARDFSKADNTLDNFELVLHVDARGVVSKVEGADALLDKLAGNDSGKRAALSGALSQESLKAAATQALHIMPDKKEVKEGEKWDVSDELKLGAMGRAKLERTIVLDAVKQRGATKVAQLSFSTRVTDYQPAKEGDNTFRISEGTLKLSEGKGSMELDLNAGRLSEAESSMKLQGNVTLLNKSAVYRGKLTQEQTVKIKVHDRLPPKEEPK